MAKTFDELNSMTHEDLVRYAQELQEAVTHHVEKYEKEEQAMMFYFNKYKKLLADYKAMRGMIENIITLTDKHTDDE